MRSCWCRGRGPKTRGALFSSSFADKKDHKLLLSDPSFIINPVADSVKTFLVVQKDVDDPAAACR